MKFSTIATLITLSNLTQGYVISSSTESTWETLTPTATWSGGLTDYTTTFGIAVATIGSSSSSSASAAAKRKRDVISQISDGQIQATTSTASTSSTTSTTAEVVSQISDGQIQATTSTASTTKTTSTAAVVSQISDGQIQATTSTATTSSSTAEVVSQISDGQIQATTSTSSKTTTTLVSGVSQISDGQVQATTVTTSTTSSSATSTSDSSDDSDDSDDDDYVTLESCKTSSSLAMILKDSILTDSSGRIGSIVANHQFQFDGPPPQAGAIYAKGWEITQEGYLAIGDNDIFYQCLSGDFYNLYDEDIGSECYAIHLEVVNLETCS